MVSWEMFCCHQSTLINRLQKYTIHAPRSTDRVHSSCSLRCIISRDYFARAKLAVLASFAEYFLPIWYWQVRRRLLRSCFLCLLIVILSLSSSSHSAYVDPSFHVKTASLSFILCWFFYSLSVRFVLRIIMVFVYLWVLSSWGIYLIRRGVIFASEACASTPFYLCKMSYTFRKSKVVRQIIDALGCYRWFSTGHILVQSAQISQINLGMKRLSRKLNDMVHGIVLKKYGPGTAV